MKNIVWVSGGDGQDARADQTEFLAANPQLKFRNSQRGYVLCDVTPDRWQTEFKVLDQIQNRNGNLSTRQTMVVERGSARLQTA